MKKNMIFGSHTPNRGDIPRLLENVIENLLNISNKEPRMAPTARW